MDVYICVGSSCHLKGSYKIIELMRENIKKHSLEERVTLKAAFCLGKCAHQGVTIKVEEEIISGVTETNFDLIFSKYVLKNS